MELRELCFHLKNRRRMYLLDDRYSTVVAFLEGFNAALDGEPLSGFQEWASHRILGSSCPVHWSYIVASERVSGILDGKIGIDQIPADVEILLIDDLAGLIEAFLG
ncbi:hypothetical protein ACIRYZ_14365 [Kitasatospora sp. NPDC101155]|uniref:hypothetical protein n=1 Tax=Kitasatospora sp. NPDC101155 TaxID=3364097 RepID=UPI003803ABE8